MRTVVIYPGRFHPFHRGHKASYDYLVKNYGANNVFIVSSDKQMPMTSPFSFADKLTMTTKLGIPPGHVAQVKNPYQAHEITKEIDDKEHTALIFAVSEKDMAGPDARFSFAPKKNGEPSYIQPLPADGKLKPMTQHAYLAVTPTVNFKVQGADADSASEIRKRYLAGNDNDRNQIIADLYGEYDDQLRDLFDKKLQATAVNESRAVRIQQKINRLRDLINQARAGQTDNNPDYIEEKWSQKYKDSINCSNPKGFSQRAHCAGRKKKVNESSGYTLQGSFTPDLTKSKVWLMTELAKVAPTVGTVYILGSWYGNLSLYMNLMPIIKFTNIINVEKDAGMLEQCQRMHDHIGAENIECMLKDANDLDYRQLGNAGVVINCSLTDMDGTDWFEHIPDGTLVAMQARDHDPGYQFDSPEDIVDKFPLDQVYYTGTLPLKDPETRYNRFMVIGRK